MSAPGFVVAAIAMLVCLAPAGIVIARGDLGGSLIGYEFLTGVIVMVFALLAEGFGRPSLFEFPVLAAALLYGSGLVFARALERGLWTREIVADVLLGLAVLIVAASALGVLIMPDAYAKLHYVTPAAVVAPVLVAAAIFVQEGLDENTGETVLALFFMVVAAPFLPHVTLRAIRVRERGDWRLKSAERDRRAERATERTR